MLSAAPPSKRSCLLAPPFICPSFRPIAVFLFSLVRFESRRPNFTAEAGQSGPAGRCTPGDTGDSRMILVNKPV